MIKDEDALCTRNVLQQRLYLCVITCLDLLVVFKEFLVALAGDKLEPRSIHRIFGFFATNIMDDGGMRLGGNIGSWRALWRIEGVIVRGLRRVRVDGKVVERRGHVFGLVPTSSLERRGSSGSESYS